MANSSEKKPATRQYHPYQDLQVPIRTLYELPTSPEYLFDEEAAVQRRSWSENLQYYTGSGYLAGAVTGGLKGSLEGLRAAEPGETLKLRTNRVLNSGGHIGRKFGNTLGVLGLIFAGLESGILHFRGTDDVLNSVAAGLGTGALYRATAGPRSAAIAGAIGGLAAGAAVAGIEVKLEMMCKAINDGVSVMIMQQNAALGAQCALSVSMWFNIGTAKRALA